MPPLTRSERIKAQKAKAIADVDASDSVTRDRLLSIVPTKASRIPVMQGGKHLIQLKHHDSEQKYTNEEIKAYATLIQENLLDELEGVTGQDMGGMEAQMMISNYYDESIAWQSGKWFRFGDAPNFYDFANQYDFQDVQLQNNFARFNLLIKLVPSSGGKTKYNHCLFICLCQAFNGKQYLPTEINTTAKVKQLCEVQFTDPVPVESLSLMEAKVPSLGITVYGDINCPTQNPEAMYQIRLKLVNGHFVYEGNKKAVLKKCLISGFCFKAASKLEVLSNDLGLSYNGETFQPIDDAFLYNTNFYKRKKDDTMFCHVKTYNKKAMIDKQFLVAAHDQRQLDTEVLQEACKRAIKELQFGFTLRLDRCPNEKVAALWLFAKLNANVHKQAFKPLQPVEAQWVDFASGGGLQFAEAGAYPKAYSYDLNKMYLFLLSHATSQMNWQNKGVHHTLFVPMDEGEYRTVLMDDPFYIDKDDKYNYVRRKFNLNPATKMNIIEVGIYHCQVEGEHKLFKKKKNNYYTHYDVATAVELGLKVSLVDDGYPNMLIYTQCVTATKLFKAFVHFMTKIKAEVQKIAETKPEAKQTLKTVKMIGNCLWGGLCQKNVKYQAVSEQNPVDLDTYDPIYCEDRGEDTYRLKMQHKGDPYKTPYARLGPFITSFGRRDMYDQLLPHQAHVKRVHTDGFISTKKLKALSISDTIGGWKVEKKGSCEVVHVNKQIWN